MTVWCQTYQAQQADLHSTPSTHCIEPIHTLTRYFADIYALSEFASYESVPIRQYIQFRIHISMVAIYLTQTFTNMLSVPRGSLPDQVQKSRETC
jgi:hypothetical protein